MHRTAASSSQEQSENSGKTVLITGMYGNLGQAVTRKFITEGFQVIGTVIPNDPLPVSFPSAGFEKKEVDLMNEEASENFVSAVIEKYKRIDVAVLTVGGFTMGHLAETTSAVILKQYQLNFETAYHIARPVFVQMMKQNHGRIFMVGSRPGLDAKNSKGMVAYGLTKSLIFRLAEQMNAEGKEHNVVTAVVVPSTLDTPQNRKAMPEANPDNWVKPEAIADIIYFYCTPEAAAIREPVIKVYGNA